MIEEKINKTLSELEANLRNVESARKQVESTVNSYEGIKAVTANYVKNLSSIENNLHALITAIGADYEKNTDSFQRDCKEITTSCNSLISKINDAVENINGKVSSQIDKIHKKFMYVIICSVIVWVTMLMLFFISK